LATPDRKEERGGKFVPVRKRKRASTVPVRKGACLGRPRRKKKEKTSRLGKKKRKKGGWGRQKGKGEATGSFCSNGWEEGNKTLPFS